MRFILFIILFSTFFGCGDGLDAPPVKAPTFTPRAESEIEDCEISGIGEERDEEIFIHSIKELEALHTQPVEITADALRYPSTE